VPARVLYHAVESATVHITMRCHSPQLRLRVIRHQYVFGRRWVTGRLCGGNYCKLLYELANISLQLKQLKQPKKPGMKGSVQIAVSHT
jgi:hypothetical protein